MGKVNAKTCGKFFPLPTIFSVLGLILMVYSIIVNDWEGAIMGAFWFLAFFPDALLKRIKLKIFHRLCLLAVGVLGYYVSSLTLLGVIMLLVGVVSLADAIRLIIRRNP